MKALVAVAILAALFTSYVVGHRDGMRAEQDLRQMRPAPICVNPAIQQNSQTRCVRECFTRKVPM